MYLAASPDTGKDIAVHRHRYRGARTKISRGTGEDITGAQRKKSGKRNEKKEKFHARFPKEMLNFERNKVAFAWESAVST